MLSASIAAPALHAPASPLAPPQAERPVYTDYARYKVIPARHPWRAVGSVFAALAIASALYSIASNPRWGWDVFAQWFFAPAVLDGLAETLELTASAALCGFVLGAGLALARLSKSPLLAGLAWAYIWLLRSIPVIVLLLVLYNLGYLYETIRIGVPFTDIVVAQYPTTKLLTQFAAALLGLSLNQAAFSAEIIRGGILSVDHGQLEAAAALGLPRHRQVFRILLPQAMRAILPGAFNEIIGLAKATSMVYVLALPELFYTVQVIYRRNMEVIPLLMVATIWYLIILTALSLIQFRVERHFAKGALRSAAAPANKPHAASAPRSASTAPAFAGAAFDGVASGEVGIHGVSKSFGDHLVLRNISLTVPAGDVTVILGPSGSGKSTLLRAINHLEKVDSGFITIDGELIGYRQDGETLHELKEDAILRHRAEVGMVFQGFNLFAHLTVLENLIEAPISVRKTPRAEAIAIARDLLAKVGLADKENAYPRHLSGGQQQRVAIARALALRPKALLFDEPTSALDPELVGEVLDVIKELARTGSTLIIVTHEIGFAREVADTVVFMDGGEILEIGAPARIFTDPQHPRTREFLAKVL